MNRDKLEEKLEELGIDKSEADKCDLRYEEDEGDFD